MALLKRDLSEIRVAVAGLGKMGQYHARALLTLASGDGEAYYKAGLPDQIGKLRLVGLCDRDASRRAAFPEVPFFTDFDALLREAEPDLAVIASPSLTHFALGMAALKSGAHAFIEKPIANTLTEWSALSELARQKDLRLMAGHVERYNPVAIKMRSLIQGGAWSVRTYRFERCQAHDPRIPDDIVTDKLIHDLDLALYFFGTVSEWEILGHRVEGGKIQELSVRLRHDRGARGELFISWLVPGPDKVRRCRLETEDGRLVEGDFAAKELSVAGQRVDPTVPGWVKPDNNQVKDELADFIGHSLEALPGDEIKPLLSPREITHSTALIEKIGQALRRRPGGAG